LASIDARVAEELAKERPQRLRGRGFRRAELRKEHARPG
jgi:hypothetical protein